MTVVESAVANAGECGIVRLTLKNAYGAEKLILTPRRQKRDTAAAALYRLHSGLERVLAGQPIALAVAVGVIDSRPPT